jgi:xanthine dehydrogenase small subunit
MISFILNNQLIKTEKPSGTVLLDFIRDGQNLKGTKEGCREGDCGACLVLLGEMQDGPVQYKSINSCLLPLADVHGCHVVTIEGIDTGKTNPLQQAFVDEGATQCGYCTPGFIMAEMGFILNNPDFDPQKAIAAMDGNICRCTGYQSIKRAVTKTCNNLVCHSEPVLQGEEPTGSQNCHSERSEESPQQNKTLGSFGKERHQNDRLIELIKLKYLPDYFAGIAERLSIIKYRNPQESEILIAGGTDLFVQREPQISNKNIQAIFNNLSLKGIKEEKGQIFLGAATTVSEISESIIIQKYFPKIGSFLKLHSSTPIRNRATLGGNIVNASPIGDMTLFLLGLDAVLILDLNGQKREVPLKSFFKAYKQFDLKKGELIKTIYFKAPSAHAKFNFEKVSRRTYLDIASVTSAALIETNEDKIIKIHISAGGVAPYPFYLIKTCDYLTGKAISVETVQNAIKIMKNEIAPISDMRGSAEYKSLLLGQLIIAHFSVLFPKKVKVDEFIG